MKYKERCSKFNKKVLQQFCLGLIVTMIAITSGCEMTTNSSNSEVETKTISQEFNTAELSKVDQKPIQVMSEREFYMAESDYLDFAIQKLAQNGATIVDA